MIFHLITNFTAEYKRIGIFALKTAAIVAVAAGMTGCFTTGTGAGGENTVEVDAGPRVFHVRGFVQGVKSDGTLILVRHETIEGYMPSMTMPFFVKDPQEVMDLREGEAIRFEYTINGRDSYISNVVKIEPGDIHLPSP